MAVKTNQAMTWTSPTETARFRRAMEDQQRKQLATAIRQRREYKGWTEARLAHESGVSIETISRLENAKTANPRDHTLSSLANAFDMTSDELAGPRLSPEAMDSLARTQLDRIEDLLVEVRDALAERGLSVGDVLAEPSPAQHEPAASSSPPAVPPRRQAAR